MSNPYEEILRVKTRKDVALLKMLLSKIKATGDAELWELLFECYRRGVLK
jgi:hypothetical protein